VTENTFARGVAHAPASITNFLRSSPKCRTRPLPGLARIFVGDSSEFGRAFRPDRRLCARTASGFISGPLGNASCSNSQRRSRPASPSSSARTADGTNWRKQGPKRLCQNIAIAVEEVVKHARETDHAPSLMYALPITSMIHLLMLYGTLGNPPDAIRFALASYPQRSRAASREYGRRSFAAAPARQLHAQRRCPTSAALHSPGGS
jgi:hypothetical protein